MFIDRYRQCIDVEGETGIVVRGIGTATLIKKLHNVLSSPRLPTAHSRFANIDEQLASSPDRIERYLTCLLYLVADESLK